MPAREFYDQVLLDRFRPQLRYDRQYDYRATAVDGVFSNEGNLLRRRDGDVVARVKGAPGLALALFDDAGYPGGLAAEPTDCLCQGPDHPGDARRLEDEHGELLYGRCVEDGGQIWLQYWLWLYYNPKNLFGFGKHEGDWEMVQYGLDAHARDLAKATYAQHDHGEARTADRIERTEQGHPVAYVAPLSHASYFEAATHPYVLGIDHPYGDGPRSTPPVVPFGAWAKWPGRWGNSEHVMLGKLGNGPRSPAWQNPKWSSPATWHEQIAGRRRRAALGKAAHAVGAYTYPPAPSITATREPHGVRVRYQLGGHGVRQARHLYLTVHDDRDRVLESRAVRDARSGDEEALLVPDMPSDLTVVATAFNRLRQRSDLAQTHAAPA